MTVSRPLAWAFILVTLVGSSLIRQLHEYVPEWAPLPWPVRSPLYAFLVILFVLVALGTPRPKRQMDPPRGRVWIGALSPLLLAILYEKILSITLYEALLEHAVGVPWLRNHMDAGIHMVIGAGMTVAVLLLVPLMQGVRLPDLIQWNRVRSGLYMQSLALFFVYGLLLGLANLFGGRELGVGLIFPVGLPVVLLLVGQGIRAMSEEFYYRGLLQQELVALTRSLGIRSLRSGQALAIALVALGFGIEHFRFGAPIAESYRGFAYAMAVGCLFGYLLVLTRNVFFCGLVHATNNFFSADLMPSVGTPDRELTVPPETILYLYLVAVFVLVFVVASVRHGDIRRVLLPGTEPPLRA